MTDKAQTVLQNIVRIIDEFDEKCEDESYTDPDEVWVILNQFRDGAKKAIEAMTRYIDVCKPVEDILAFRLEVGEDIPADVVDQGEAAVLQWFRENDTGERFGEPKVYEGDSDKPLWVDFAPFGDKGEKP